MKEKKIIPSTLIITLLATTSSTNLLCSVPKDILTIKDGITNRVKNIQETGKTIVSKAKAISNKPYPLHNATENTKNFLVTLKKEAPKIGVSIVDILGETKKITDLKILGIKVFNKLNLATKITKKIDAITKNLQGSIKNLEGALDYLIEDFQKPVEEFHNFILGINKTGLYELFPPKK